MLRALPSLVFLTFGCRGEFGDAKLLEEFSPIRAVDRIRAPLFIYQGQNDRRVPRAQSDTLVREMRRRGVPVEYMVAPACSLA